MLRHVSPSLHMKAFTLSALVTAVAAEVGNKKCTINEVSINKTNFSGYTMEPFYNLESKHFDFILDHNSPNDLGIVFEASENCQIVANVNGIERSSEGLMQVLIPMSRTASGDYIGYSIDIAAVPAGSYESRINKQSNFLSSLSDYDGHRVFFNVKKRSGSETRIQELGLWDENSEAKMEPSFAPSQNHYKFTLPLEEDSLQLLLVLLDSQQEIDIITGAARSSARKNSKFLFPRRLTLAVNYDDQDEMDERLAYAQNIVEHSEEFDDLVQKVQSELLDKNLDDTLSQQANAIMQDRILSVQRKEANNIPVTTEDLIKEEAEAEAEEDEEEAKEELEDSAMPHSIEQALEIQNNVMNSIALEEQDDVYGMSNEDSLVLEQIDSIEEIPQQDKMIDDGIVESEDDSGIKKAEGMEFAAPDAGDYQKVIADDTDEFMSMDAMTAVNSTPDNEPQTKDDDDVEVDSESTLAANTLEEDIEEGRSTGLTSIDEDNFDFNGEDEVNAEANKYIPDTEIEAVDVDEIDALLSRTDIAVDSPFIVNGVAKKNLDDVEVIDGEVEREQLETIAEEMLALKQEAAEIAERKEEIFKDNILVEPADVTPIESDEPLTQATEADEDAFLAPLDEETVVDANEGRTILKHENVGNTWTLEVGVDIGSTQTVFFEVKSADKTRSQSYRVDIERQACPVNSPFVLKQTCVKTCPPGTFADITTNNNCIACVTPGCSLCPKGFCTKCQEGLVLDSKSILPSAVKELQKDLGVKAKGLMTDQCVSPEILRSTYSWLDTNYYTPEEREGIFWGLMVLSIVAVIGVVVIVIEVMNSRANAKFSRQLNFPQHSGQDGAPSNSFQEKVRAVREAFEITINSATGHGRLIENDPYSSNMPLIPESLQESQHSEDYTEDDRTPLNSQPCNDDASTSLIRSPY